MNSNDNEEDGVPEGWVLCRSKSTPGRKYFFNRRTGQSLWTRPEAEDLPSQKWKSAVQEKRDRLQKEEAQKRCIKRKSDVNYEGSSPKKKVTFDLKSPEPRKKEIPSPIPAKNSASKRLKLLQNKLAEEVQKEEASSTSNLMKSPAKPNTKKDIRFSPKVNQSPTSKTGNKTTELKSPIQNENSSVQSPSDSITSMPSPSQFLAANKILSSMKAQLPEEYSFKTKAKPKDTFADIEAGICNQTADYSSMKHPATPPQFSEANKIVSAIKSKLDYKSTIKDYSDIEAYASANDRMAALRKSLSNEVEELSTSSPPMEVTSLERLNSISSIEAMDCEESKISQVSSPRLQSPESSGSSQPAECSNENVVLVVDTNIFIHELDVIRNSLNSHIKGYKHQPTLVVPWRVVNELDRLKDNNNGSGAVCKRARAAMDYLYQSLPENNKIKGQSLRDANSHIYPCELPDDEILNCCLQQAERGNAVILLSNDKNLCNKAMINGVKCLRLSELAALVERRAEPALAAAWLRHAAALRDLLAAILENEMRAKYDKLWLHIVHSPPPWELRAVLAALLRHWPAVFQEVFPRIQQLLSCAADAVRAVSDPKYLTRSDVDHFRDLCLEIARKCQIIPEYMELAKKTVEKVLQKTEQCEVVNSTQDESSLVPSFEAVWKVFSSFCGNLASALDVPHALSPGTGSAESARGAVDELLGQWAIYSEQTKEFTLAIHGALTVTEDCSPEDERITRLETVFKDNLKLINMDENVVTLDNLKAFCTKCKEMLQEAYTKFSQLSELLDTCRNVMHSAQTVEIN